MKLVALALLTSVFCAGTALVGAVAPPPRRVQDSAHPVNFEVVLSGAQWQRLVGGGGVGRFAANFTATLQADIAKALHAPAAVGTINVLASADLFAAFAVNTTRPWPVTASDRPDADGHASTQQFAATVALYTALTNQTDVALVSIARAATPAPAPAESAEYMCDTGCRIFIVVGTALCAFIGVGVASFVYWMVHRRSRPMSTTEAYNQEVESAMRPAPSISNSVKMWSSNTASARAAASSASATRNGSASVPGPRNYSASGSRSTAHRTVSFVAGPGDVSTAVLRRTPVDKAMLADSSNVSNSIGGPAVFASQRNQPGATGAAPLRTDPLEVVELIACGPQPAAAPVFLEDDTQEDAPVEFMDVSLNVGGELPTVAGPDDCTPMSQLSSAGTVRTTGFRRFSHAVSPQHNPYDAPDEVPRPLTGNDGASPATDVTDGEDDAVNFSDPDEAHAS
jgi:hypothetical protein